MATTYSLPKGALSTTTASPEMSQADIDYKNEIQKLRDSLENRKGLNPTMLALAQGFFAPTKSGGFGESISNAVANYLPAQQAEEKAIQERAGLRLQLATAEKGEANKLAAQKGFQQVIGGAPAAAPAAGGAQVGGQNAGQVGGQGGGQGAPSQGKSVTIQDALNFAGQFPDQKDMAARLMEAAKAGSDRYKTAQNGVVFDSWTGKYLDVDIPGQTQSKFSTPYGSFDMLPNEYSRFTMAQKAGMGRQWMNAFKSGAQFEVDKLVAEKLGGVPSKAAVDNQPDGGGRKTVSESEADAAAAKVRAEKMAGSEAERTNLVNDAASAARTNLVSYQTANEILKDKDVRDRLGVLRRGDFLSAFGNLVNEAFRVGNYSVGIPAIKDIIKESGASQDTINKLARLAQIESQIQMQERKGLGAGTSISNMEQMMANRSAITQDDPYGAYLEKVKAGIEKENFRIALASELRKRKMTIDEFEETPKFQEMFDAYSQRLSKVYEPAAPAKPSTSKPATTPSTGGPSAAGAKLRQELGIK